MNICFYIILIVCGLSGCAARNPGHSEQLYLCTDSLRQLQSDSLNMRQNREVLTRIKSQYRQLSFSPPDSAGRQHIQSITYATEERRQKDSTELVLIRSSDNDIRTYSLAAVKAEETVKEKRYPVVWVLAGLVIISFIYYFLGRK